MNKINLRSVKENNLISVAIRSEFSKEHEDVYIDEKAQEIMHKINRDFRKAKKNKKKVRDEMAKVILIDDMLSEFIKKHPNVNVVNIGCGLDTRYYRVDSEELKILLFHVLMKNGQKKWIQKVQKHYLLLRAYQCI